MPVLAANHSATMGDYYPNFLSSVMAGTEGHGGNSPGEFNYPFMPGASMPVNVAPSGHRNFGYFQGYAEAAGSSRPRQSNYRRKSTGGNVSGTEQTKHRRTRSGCFMCRSRRVKVTFTNSLLCLCLLIPVLSVTKLDRFANVGVYPKATTNVPVTDEM